MIVALLDANVLWSAPIRDTLLRAAELDLFKPLWTTQILEEFSRTFADRRRDISVKQIERLIIQLNAAFPTASVNSYEQLIHRMTNDPGDRHVLAAAVAGQANVVVTWNLAHFRATDCTAFDIRAVTPDMFLLELCDEFPAVMLSSIEQAADLRHPPIEMGELLKLLEPTLPAFVSRLRQLA